MQKDLSIASLLGIQLDRNEQDRHYKRRSDKLIVLRFYIEGSVLFSCMGFSIMHQYQISLMST